MTRALVAASFLAAQSLAPAIAHADEPPREVPGFDVLGFTVRPGVEARVRGEYRRNPLNDGIYGEHPLLLIGMPESLREPYQDQALVWERLRLRLEVERGPVLVHFSFQDVRSFGTNARLGALAGQPELPITEPYEGYIDLSDDERDIWFRIGRQAIELGDGRLVGKSPDRAPGRAFDALRIGGRVGDFDLGAFAAMLVFPGEPTVPDPSGEGPTLAPGAQLYALDATWRVAPYFGAELTGLARIVRQPLVSWLTPSDTFVAALRAFGDYRGVRYSVVGAFEGGRVAPVGEVDNATLIAGAVAGRVEWETNLPLRLTFGAQGAYASGDPAEGDSPDSIGVFDPLFPDTTKHFGQGDFYALSNLIEGGADVAIRPVDEFSARVGYRFAGLANARGPWHTGALFPVGQSASNDSQMLGHVISAELEGRPWEQLFIRGSYGVMLLGDGAKNIFQQARPGLDAAKVPDFAEFLGVDIGADLP